MSSFKKKCTFCGLDIQLNNDSGKWLPRNLDNSFHECKGREDSKPTREQQPQIQQPQKVVLEQQPTEQAKTVWTVLEEYNKRLKKLEGIVLKDGPN